MNILLSRPDNLGDVMLTLPMAGWLKAQWPRSKIFFLGKSYTKALVDCCHCIDFFLDRDTLLAQPYLLKEHDIQAFIHVLPDYEVAKIAYSQRVPLRVGTSHRLQHWLTCNRRINLGRRDSPLHEAQLNIQLLGALGLPTLVTVADLPKYYGFSAPQADVSMHQKPTLILHPKSKGSAREWPLTHYYQLAESLPHLRIAITGTETEGNLIRQECPQIFKLPHVQNLTGQLSLRELIALIAQTKVLVACSTGPLHIAAALGIHTLGIYPSIKPMHIGRWGALGYKVQLLAQSKECRLCASIAKDRKPCACIGSIEPKEVMNRILACLATEKRL